MKKSLKLLLWVLILSMIISLVAVFSSSGCRATKDKIAFTSYRDGYYEIYIMNVDGSGQTRLTNNLTGDLSPCFSPDGTKIAFESERGVLNIEESSTDEEIMKALEALYTDIYLMNVDGSGRRRLTDNPITDEDPCFSPDGSKIAFTSYSDGNGEIYIMNVDGSGQTRLTNNSVGDWSPCFSPDGSKIAFVSSRDGSWEIYIMNVDGSGQKRLENNLEVSWDPCFSPDGSKIAFTSFIDGNREIYIMNVDGSGQTRLTNNLADDREPSFSPDGFKIAFQSDRDTADWETDWEIYIMNVDGSGQINLTNSPGYDGHPCFSR